MMAGAKAWVDCLKIIQASEGAELLNRKGEGAEKLGRQKMGPVLFWISLASDRLGLPNQGK